MILYKDVTVVFQNGGQPSFFFLNKDCQMTESVDKIVLYVKTEKSDCKR